MRKPIPSTQPLARAPMFHTCVDANSVPYPSNAHPQSEYEDHRDLLYPGAPLSHQVCMQVFGSEASRHGGMTFPSLADDPHKPVREPYPEEMSQDAGVSMALFAAKERK
jgi:hypothetical protein